MRIQVTSIRNWFDPDMDLREAWGIVSREYCIPLNRVNACPKNCGLCKERLEKMFDLSQARKPAALLTYLARRERAYAIDAARDHEAPEPHVDVVSDVENPFTAFADQL